MTKVVGIDLGVRSIHVSTQECAVSITVDKSERSGELRKLFTKYMEMFDTYDTVAFIEEPLVAGPRNIRTALQMAQLAGALMSVMPSYLVPVATWKKEVVGKGNATKDDVADYLRPLPEFAYTDGSQDLIDATCIRMYGERQMDKVRV